MKQAAVIVFTAVLMLAFGACGTNTKGELRPSGYLAVNGPGVDGSVSEGEKRLFILSTIQGSTTGQEVRYELRTSVTDSASRLVIAVYPSESDYNTGRSPLAVASNVAINQSLPGLDGSFQTYYYEASFLSTSAGDYVAVVSAPAESGRTQFFYGLRIMSASPGPASIKSFSTTTLPASSGTDTIGPDDLQVYNGGSLTPQGTYPVSLMTATTTTIPSAGYPQMFIYKDNTLALRSLMMSSVPTTSYFNVTTFSTNTANAITAQTVTSNDASLSGVSFTTGTGPFIVLRGIVSSTTYSLTVGP